MGIIARASLIRSKKASASFPRFPEKWRFHFRIRLYASAVVVREGGRSRVGIVDNLGGGLWLPSRFRAPMPSSKCTSKSFGSSYSSRGKLSRGVEFFGIAPWEAGILPNMSAMSAEGPGEEICWAVFRTASSNRSSRARSTGRIPVIS